MKKYNFLFKPFFFILNLLFATWLVLAIEKIKPSDFGKYGAEFENKIPEEQMSKEEKDYLKNLFHNYRSGKIDSTEFNKQMNLLLKNK